MRRACAATRCSRPDPSRRRAAARWVAGTLLCLPIPGFTAGPATAAVADPGIDWNLTAQQIDESCERAVARARSEIRDATTGRADALARLRTIEAALAGMQETLVAQQVLAYMAEDDAQRDASAGCNELMERVRIEVSSDRAVHEVARAAAARANSSVDKQLARVYIEAGNRAGAGLSLPARAELSSLLEQLSQVQNDYQRALSENRATIEISEAEAASLPKHLVATLDRNEDNYLVPVHLGTWELFMKNARPADVRKRFLMVFFESGGADNSRRLMQAVRLRERVAELTGFPSWAAYQLDTQMAKTPEQAMALVREVSERLMPKARAEIAALSALKVEDGDRTPFAAWDYLYYQERLENTRYAVSTEEVRQYLPAQHVVAAVLDIYQALLGVKFHPVAPARAWAADVQQHRIADAASGATLGWFYIDITPRPHRFVRPSTFALRAGRALPDGTYLAPLAAIAGNGPAAPPGQPVLFTHKDAVDFFHEFGHVMHMTLSAAPYASLHGARVREDFVEAPSQMLENWMWDAAILRKVSRHVATGRPLPEELVARLVARKHAADGVFWTRQAFLAAYDLTLHSGRTRPDGKGEIDPDRLWMELMPQFTPLPAPSGTHPAASFLPVMGGYEARYYGYLWSRVYAQDMFTAFQRAGLQDPAVGMRYRREILEPGATAEPQELLRSFLGRPLGHEAFYEEIGVRPARPAGH